MTGTIGYGQQDPSSTTDEFNKVSFLVSQMVARLDTMKLVKVVTVTGGAGAVAKAGTVDVLPLVNQIDGAGNAQTHGTVYGLPWSRVQGGKNAVICDPEVGDIGWVVAADRDTSVVRSTAAQGNPGSFRKFNIADGVYAGGVLDDVPEQYLRFSADGIELHDKAGNKLEMKAGGVTLTDATGNVIQTSSSGITLTPAGSLPVTIPGNLAVGGNLLLGGTVEGSGGGVYAGNIHTSGTITGDTDVVGAGKSLASHEHTYLRPSSGATTPTPTSAPI